METAVIVLIADGGNDLEIPCRIFPDDMDLAKDTCDQLLETEGEIDGDTVIYKVDLERAPKEISQRIFTRHYYGCGGPGYMHLKRVEFNTAFVGFDLD